MIEVNGLTKAYGATRVVEDVSFACEPGSVTGFVGPNGAGKSTTLRMLCGLTPPDAGHATIAGRPYRALPEPSRTVGVLLDASAFHPGRTGRDTLKRAAELADAPAENVDAVLQRVGLAGKPAGRRVGDYSLGMRQRLGIGLALIAEPSVLILDEPANGLDPEGIAWMRRLLRDFADRGGTVLLSSHLLSEVEATVDQLVVIGDGKIVAAGALRDLLGTGATRVRSADVDALAAALERDAIEFTRVDADALTVKATTERVSQASLDAGVVLSELRSEGLEGLFFSLTGEHSRNPLDQEEVPA